MDFCAADTHRYLKHNRFPLHVVSDKNFLWCLTTTRWQDTLTSHGCMLTYSISTIAVKLPVTSPLLSVIACIVRKFGFVCASGLAFWNYSRRLKRWNLCPSISYGPYPKVGADFNTLLWSRPSSQICSRWFHWCASARWTSLKHFCNTRFRGMDLQRHYSQTKKNKLYLSSSGV